MQCPYIIKHNHHKPSAWEAKDAMIDCPSIPPAHDWLEGIDGQVSGRMHPGVAGSSPCMSSMHLMATLPDAGPCCVMGIWPSVPSNDREYRTTG